MLVRTGRLPVRSKTEEVLFLAWPRGDVSEQQGVWHAHIHVIPRYKGDVPNPRGGVRGVIPYKASY